ncbi:MAG: 2'-5' RNA ligase family protein [Christensenellaceae bacterium]
MNEQKTYCAMAVLDDACAKKICEIKELLCKQGLACDIVPSHITLGIYDGLSVEKLLAWAKAFAASRQRFQLKVNHIGIFAARTLFLAPQVSQALLSFYQAFHEKYDVYADHFTKKSENNWTPHCTLFNGDMQEIQAALPIVADAFAPFMTEVTGIMIGEFVSDMNAFTPSDEIETFLLV